MRKVEGNALRSYSLAPEQTGAAVSALVALAEGLGGAGLAISRTDSPESNGVPVPSGLLAPLIDLVSLLVCKGDATVMVLDGNDEVSTKEAMLLLQCRWQGVEKLVEDGSLAPRKHLQGNRFKIADLLSVIAARAVEAGGTPNADPAGFED